MKNKLGPNHKEHEFEIYKDRPVRVGLTSNNSAMGIVEDYSTEYLYLKPSIVHHGIYDLDGKLINNAIIEKDFPQKVRITNITHIEPLKIGYLEKLAKSLNNNTKSSRIILPYQKIK